MSVALPWFPVLAADHLALAAQMTPEQFGALMRLRCVAWLAEPPCTVPDDETILGSITGLGERYGAVAVAFRSILKPCGDGRLCDEPLMAVYEKQLARAVAGRKAGLASASRRSEVRGATSGQRTPQRIGNVLSRI